MPLKVLSTALLLVLLCGAPHRIDAQTADWLEYRDATTSLSFRYPKTLQAIKRAFSPNDGNESFLHTQEEIDLVARDKLDHNPPGLPVLTLRVINNSVFPDRPWVETFETERRLCRHWQSLSIDGHRALECVSCGSAACQWSVQLFQPRRVSIIEDWYGDDDPDMNKVHLHDGRFPMLSIVKTVRITAPK